MHDVMLKLFEMQINALLALMKGKSTVAATSPVQAERNALGGPGPISTEKGGLVE